MLGNDVSSDLTAAVNALNVAVGSASLSGSLLNSTISSDITGAIADIVYAVGSSVLTTENSNIADAINELEGEIDILQTNVTNISNDLGDYAKMSDLGDLYALSDDVGNNEDLLTTSANTTIVDAINFIYTRTGIASLNDEVTLNEVATSANNGLATLQGIIGFTELTGPITDLLSSTVNTVDNLNARVGTTYFSPGTNNGPQYLNRCTLTDDVYTVGRSVFYKFDYSEDPAGPALSTIPALQKVTGYIAAMAQCATWQLSIRDQDLYITTNNTAGITGTTEDTGCTQVLDMQMANAYCNSVFDTWED